MNVDPTISRIAAFLGLCLVLVGCGGGDGRGTGTTTISEATFVAAVAELHHASSGALDGDLTDAERTAILQRHGVQESDLLTFAKVHGPDIAYMREVWQGVAQSIRHLDLEHPDAELDSGVIP